LEYFFAKIRKRLVDCVDAHVDLARSLFGR